MVATRGWNTEPERQLRSELHGMGLRFRLHRRPVSGIRREADIVFTAARVAVLMDGCFWHGCPLHATTPKANAEFWKEKLAANIRRDRDTDARLKAAGWTVIRVWEHDDRSAAARRISRIVGRNRKRLQIRGGRRPWQMPC